MGEDDLLEEEEKQDAMEIKVVFVNDKPQTFSYN